MAPVGNDAVHGQYKLYRRLISMRCQLMHGNPTPLNLCKPCQNGSIHNFQRGDIDALWLASLGELSSQLEQPVKNSFHIAPAGYEVYSTSNDQSR